MTCEERIAISLRLHELASQMARVGIRAVHPQATDAEVEHELHQRRKLAWKVTMAFQRFRKVLPKLEVA